MNIARGVLMLLALGASWPLAAVAQPVVSQSGAAPRPADGSGREELAYLEARSCSQAGDIACAQGAVERLKGLFPGSQLTDLALVLEARAAAAAGDMSRAAAAVTRLQAEYPTSRAYLTLEGGLKRLAVAAPSPAAAVGAKAAAPGAPAVRTGPISAANWPAAQAAAAGLGKPLAVWTGDDLVAAAQAAGVEDEPALVSRQQAGSCREFPALLGRGATPVEPPHLLLVPLDRREATVGENGCFEFQLSAGSGRVETVSLRLAGLEEYLLTVAGEAVAALDLHPGAALRLRACGTVPASLRDGELVSVELTAVSKGPGAEVAVARSTATVSRAFIKALFRSRPRYATTEGTPVSVTLINAGRAAARSVDLTLEAGGGVTLSPRRFALGEMRPGEVVTVTASAAVSGEPLQVPVRFCVNQAGEVDCGASPPLELR